MLSARSRRRGDEFDLRTGERDCVVNKNDRLVDKRDRLVDEAGRTVDEADHDLSETGRVVNRRASDANQPRRGVNRLARLVDERAPPVDEAGRPSIESERPAHGRRCPMIRFARAVIRCGSFEDEERSTVNGHGRAVSGLSRDVGNAVRVLGKPGRGLIGVKLPRRAPQSRNNSFPANPREWARMKTETPKGPPKSDRLAPPATPLLLL